MCLFPVVFVCCLCVVRVVVPHGCFRVCVLLVLRFYSCNNLVCLLWFPLSSNAGLCCVVCACFFFSEFVECIAAVCLLSFYRFTWCSCLCVLFVVLGSFSVVLSPVFCSVECDFCCLLCMYWVVVV